MQSGYENQDFLFFEKAFYNLLSKEKTEETADNGAGDQPYNITTGCKKCDAGTEQQKENHCNCNYPVFPRIYFRLRYRRMLRVMAGMF